MTKGPCHATDIVREALSSSKYHVIVSVGGDGTHHEVINGFFEPEGAPIPTETRIAFITHGTGQDTCRTLPCGKNLSENLDVIYGNNEVALDCGRLEYTTPNGLKTTHFVNECSVGFSGWVCKRVNESSLRRMFPKLTFMLGSALGFIFYKPKKITISVQGDDEEKRETNTFSTFLAAVCNGKYFGGGMMISPRAEMSDGKLEITALKDIGLATFVLQWRRLFNGTIYQKPQFCYSATSTEFHLGGPDAAEVVVEGDGEYKGTLPATITIQPAALTAKVAVTTKKNYGTA
eukprot:TRINITY_DN48365_c0_g1_i1.p1 TRINITY_DN48365_c0_g1~~TRINITY_DN48365_c0_g1_i1.p1  ORF type:complete len:339 (-),score=17.10 TRINITY_DN48365_c0_g1_i1:69-938(-)